MSDEDGKKILIIKPRYGLCNQLYCISKGIVLGIISNRDIIFNGFQLDYKNIDNICNFNKIININHLQKILDERNINIKVYADIEVPVKKIETYVDLKISHIKDFIPILFYENNINEKYLDIDNPISFDIPKEYNDLIQYIDLNIKFTDEYINLSNKIIEKLDIKNYICCHLRLEDDAINYMYDISKENLNNYTKEDINNISKIKFINEISNIRSNNNSKIYICTSLGIENNINNDFYIELKKKYDLIDKKDIASHIEMNNNCREIYAIVDFLIAKQSIYFIGTDWSSFSIYIYSNHIYNNKYAKMINIWEDFNA